MAVGRSRVVLMDAELSHRPPSPETHVWVLLLVEEFVERVDRLGCQGLYTSHARLVRGLSRLGVVAIGGFHWAHRRPVPALYGRRSVAPSLNSRIT